MSRSLELSAAYARLILQSELVSPEQLLAGTGTDAQALAETDYIDWKILARMLRNLDEQMDTQARSSSWAAQMGEQFNITSHGPLGFAALSAPTLGAALDVMATLYPARTSAIGVEIEQSGGFYTLHLVDLTGDVQFHRRLGELVLKVLESLLSAILGHPAGSHVVIRLASPCSDDSGALTAAYDATVQFDCPDFAISVPEAWRNLPSPLYDEAVYRSNVIKCRELIAQREQHGSSADIVENMLRNHFDRIIARQTDASPPPTLASVAETIHMTTRTLIRRLKAENSAYKSILEELRREYACNLLRDARLTVGDVAEIIGYREPANFGRAFRRWYGVSPAIWRRQ